jgi:quercetin dioxygenase-like cupin family protein
VGFQVGEEKIYLAEGDILSFMPEQKHGSWNMSDEWRVTLYITTERTYWEL